MLSANTINLANKINKLQNGCTVQLIAPELLATDSDGLNRVQGAYESELNCDTLLQTVTI